MGAYPICWRGFAAGLRFPSGTFHHGSVWWAASTSFRPRWPSPIGCFVYWHRPGLNGCSRLQKYGHFPSWFSGGAAFGFCRYSALPGWCAPYRRFVCVRRSERGSAPAHWELWSRPRCWLRTIWCSSSFTFQFLQIGLSLWAFQGDSKWLETSQCLYSRVLGVHVRTGTASATVDELFPNLADQQGSGSAWAVLEARPCCSWCLQHMIS